MKKIIAAIAAAFLLTGVCAYADGYDTDSSGGIEIYIDGDKLYTEAEPINMEGYVLVPMRAVFEALDASVSWDGENKTVWASREGEFIALETETGIMSSGVFNSDGETYWVESKTLEAPPQLIEGYTYVPVRVISETLGAYVTWDGEAERVLIDSRSDVKGTIYYASDSDFQYLYRIGKNGRGRRKMSEKQIKELEAYKGYAYYIDIKTNYLYRAGEKGEELLIGKAVNKVAVADDYIYFQELDGGIKSGVLYRLSLLTGETEQLTDRSVQYPEKYKNFIYFNVEGENVMYAMTVDGSELYTVDTGDCAFSKLYPFNCIFYGDYILVEDGVWFGDIMCCRLDGSDVRQLTKINAIIEKNQQHDDRVIYMQPDNGQDIYCINIDGTDNHLVHKGDPAWIDIDTLAQWNDTVYYKHPMRKEIYRVNLDGSDDRYIGYADSIQVHAGRLFLSFLGLYEGNLDGTDMFCLYDKSIKSFAVIDDMVYFKDEATSKLCMSDFYGRAGFITCDAAGEWVETE